MNMRSLAPHFCLTLGLLGLGASAQAQETAAAPADTPASAPAAGASDQGLRFNFRGAPLEMVLNYLSDAAGFVIVLESPIHGTVDMWSTHPVSREEAINLLNLALNKNNLTATVQGRNLVISAKEDAKKRNIPVRTGNDPREIPMTAEMVMQIIPLRRIDATQALRDLGTVLPSTATITASEDSNSLIVTDTEMNIHHIVEIIAALDTSIDSETATRIFHLKNSDPVEMATLINNLFQNSATPANTNNNNNNFRPGAFFRAMAAGGAGGPAAFGAAGGFPTGGNFAVGGNNNNNGGRRNSNSSAQSRQVPVVAVPDPRTYSLIVTSSKDAMPSIAEMVAQLDSSTARKQRVFVYTMENADVHQVELILKNLFQSNTTRSTSNNTQADALSSRATTNAQSSNSSSSGALNLNNGSSSLGR